MEYNDIANAIDYRQQVWENEELQGSGGIFEEDIDAVRDPGILRERSEERKFKFLAVMIQTLRGMDNGWKENYLKVLDDDKGYWLNSVFRLFCKRYVEVWQSTHQSHSRVKLRAVNDFVEDMLKLGTKEILGKYKIFNSWDLAVLYEVLHHLGIADFIPQEIH